MPEVPLLAVALVLSLNVVGLVMAEIVDPLGMPAPLTNCPMLRALVLATVTLRLPAVVVALLIVVELEIRPFERPDETQIVRERSWKTAPRRGLG